MGLARALGGVGAVDGSLGLVVAEFDEEACGVDAVAGLEVGELALHGGDEELDDEPAVLGFLGDDVGEIGHIFYFREDGGVAQWGDVTLRCSVSGGFLTSMDKIDRMFGCGGCWIPAPYQVRGDPVSSTGQAVLSRE